MTHLPSARRGERGAAARSLRVVAMLLLGAFAAAVPSVHAGETRTWTDKTGKFRIEAEFVGTQNIAVG